MIGQVKGEKRRARFGARCPVLLEREVSRGTDNPSLQKDDTIHKSCGLETGSSPNRVWKFCCTEVTLLVVAVSNTQNGISAPYSAILHKESSGVSIIMYGA